jgi:stearoyl-CoA desaturase (delta-9 desaturase)
MFRIPPYRSVNWVTSAFLIFTALISVTIVPLHIYKHGVDWFQILVFMVLFPLSSMSITLGYHRLFSHKAFEAKWPVKLLTLIFGSTTFEGSALEWCSDHRRHHKHVDHDDDPYDITQGFFHAHIGWLLFRLNPVPPFDNVADLRKDKLVMWQYRNWKWVGILAGFGLPALLGYLWAGAAGAWAGFLINGVLRVFVVQHTTFFINSLCHTIGKRPYSTEHSARDSWIMALFTFGEGYHNYHHEFQHDFRNGVKPWQFDPTKWTILLLSKFGMASNLKRVPAEKIMLAEIREKQRLIEKKLARKSISIPAKHQHLLENASQNLAQAAKVWEEKKRLYLLATQKGFQASREKLAAVRHDLEMLKQDLDHSTAELMAAVREWTEAHNLVTSSLPA